MPNFQKLCVFDLETDGPDPEKCSPIQIAAVIVDPIKLEIIKNSEFNCNLKPEILEKSPDHTYEESDILDFHAKVRGTSKEKILSSWREYQSQEQGWKMFISYLDMYHTRSSRKSFFSAPIACGYNINRFDLKIVERLSRKYQNVDKEGKSSLFYPRDIVDVMNYMFIWFENSSELKNYKLDSIRDYLGIDKEGAHDALKDVYDTANLLIRFMKLHRSLSNKVKFKNSFTKVI
jgi:DNA polymerase III epsilon subunit-like protein